MMKKTTAKTIGISGAQPRASSILAGAASRSFLLLLLLLLLSSGCDAQTFPTPAPTPQCAPEAVAWGQCVEGGGLDAVTCFDCYSPFYDLLTDTTTCDEVASLICAQIEACAGSCGTGCGSTLEAYETCNFGSACGAVSLQSCSPASTPTFPTTPPPAPASSPVLAPSPTFGTPAPSLACPSEIAALEGCLQDSNLEAQTCVECFTAWLDSAPEDTSCEVGTSLICAQIEACASSCGSCGPSIEAYNACIFGSDCFPGCTSPTTPSGPVGSPPPAASPVSSPVSSPPSPLAAPVAEPPTIAGGGDNGGSTPAPVAGAAPQPTAPTSGLVPPTPSLGGGGGEAPDSSGAAGRRPALLTTLGAALAGMAVTAAIGGTCLA